MSTISVGSRDDFKAYLRGRGERDCFNTACVPHVPPTRPELALSPIVV